MSKLLSMKELDALIKECEAAEIAMSKRPAMAYISAADAKTCSICRESKGINQFHLKKDNPDGHKNRCKECDSRIYKERYAAKRGEVRQYRKRQK